MVFAALLLVVWVCAPPEAGQCRCAACGAMGRSTRPSDDGCFSALHSCDTRKTSRRTYVWSFSLLDGAVLALRVAVLCHPANVAGAVFALCWIVDYV